eukprot:365279-Chlamydomonas_euryale.AAC.7
MSSASAARLSRRATGTALPRPRQAATPALGANALTCTRTQRTYMHVPCKSAALAFAAPPRATSPRAASRARDAACASGPTGSLLAQSISPFRLPCRMQQPGQPQQPRQPPEPRRWRLGPPLRTRRLLTAGAAEYGRRQVRWRAWGPDACAHARAKSNGRCGCRRLPNPTAC